MPAFPGTVQGFLLFEVMEALVAIGYAANILQFVDSICHVLKVGRQLRRRGMADSTLDLERAARFLENQVVKLRAQQGAGTGSEETEEVRIDDTSNFLHADGDM